MDPRRVSTYKKDLALAGVRISLSTVRGRLLEAGRKAKKSSKKQFLFKENEKRLEWLRVNKN